MANRSGGTSRAVRLPLLTLPSSTRTEIPASRCRSHLTSASVRAWVATDDFKAARRETAPGKRPTTVVRQTSSASATPANTAASRKAPADAGGLAEGGRRRRRPKRGGGWPASPGWPPADPGPKPEGWLGG